MSNQGQKEFKAVGLRCDYRVNPIGIDNLLPRLSWKMKAYGQDRRQTAYRILALEMSDTEQITCTEQISGADQMAQSTGEQILWDSGKVLSDCSVGIVYGGKELKSRDRVYWKVQIWDENDEVSQWSDISFFEMGLLQESDWQAAWICAPKEVTAPYFRRAWTSEERPVAGRVYICGLGYYELFLNGKKCGNRLLSPNRTDYVERAFYHTYDITDEIAGEQNVIGIALGNGWYNQRDKINEKELWYGYPRLLLQMELTYGDGTKKVIVSDESFCWHESPRTYNNIYFGEIYDARKELPHWNEPGFDASDWSPACRTDAPGGKLAEQKAPSDEEVCRLLPKSINEVKPGMYVVDFGQNVTGWVRMRVSGIPGQKVQLRFGEELWPDGKINYYSTGSGWSQQKDIYILNGKGEEWYEPAFTWHGFRYMEVQGYPGRPQKGDFTAVHIRSGVERRGEFRCSDALINQIQKASLWSMEGGLHGGIPLDSPHRERQGYGGDALATAKALMYSYDMQGFYADWMDDFADAQDKETGFIPHTVPCQDGGGGPAWGCAMIVITRLLYQYYGDTRTALEHYDSMAKWMEFLRTGMENGIVEGEGEDRGCLGEWSTPGEILIPPRFVNTFFYGYCARLMAELGDVLGRKEDAKRFEEEYRHTVQAFRAEFYDPDTGCYSIGAQGTEAFANKLGCIRERELPQVRAYLADHVVKDCEGNLDTGIFGTPFLFETLIEFGLEDIAWRMITSVTYPGYGYMLSNGATTLWEYWEKEYGFYQCPGNHNQPMFGSISGCFYEKLAGITPLEPAYKKIGIAPKPIGGLRFVTAKVETPYGEVCVDWEKNDDEFLLNVTVPANTSAEIAVPGQEITEVGSGSYRFRYLMG
nr:family 78 glycoside hydrolase catalytic domain [uncultured Marvinbryantia sp.]